MPSSPDFSQTVRWVKWQGQNSFATAAPATIGGQLAETLRDQDLRLLGGRREGSLLLVGMRHSACALSHHSHFGNGLFVVGLLIFLDTQIREA